MVLGRSITFLWHSCTTISNELDSWKNSGWLFIIEAAIIGFVTTDGVHWKPSDRIVQHAPTWWVNTEQLGRVGHMQKDVVLPTGARKAILPLIWQISLPNTVTFFLFQKGYKTSLFLGTFFKYINLQPKNFHLKDTIICFPEHFH